MNTRLTILLAAALLLAACATAPAPGSAAIPDLARYHTVLIESVRVGPNAAMLTDPNRQALEHHLRAALVEAFPADLRALAPAADVLRVQVTVTALDAVEPARRAASATPVGMTLERGEIAFEVRYYRHGASAPFATTTERQKAGRFVFAESLTHYGHAVGALRAWGTGLAGSFPRT
jgi:hypothetical protein